MPDFEWSPEAIEAATEALSPHTTLRCGMCAGTGFSIRSDLDCTSCDATGIRKGMSEWLLAAATEILNVAVKAQPVVALPPCPTCKGWGSIPNSAGRPGVYIGKDDPPCTVCNGSGVERLVPVSEIRAMLANAHHKPELVEADPVTRGFEACINGIESWLDEWAGTDASTKFGQVCPKTQHPGAVGDPASNSQETQ